MICDACETVKHCTKNGCIPVTKQLLHQCIDGGQVSAEQIEAHRRNDEIHSCSYFCDKPACIKRQRDELRDKLYAAQPVTQPLTDEQAKMLWKSAHNLWVDSKNNEFITLPLIYASEIQKALGITPTGDKA